MEIMMKAFSAILFLGVVCRVSSDCLEDHLSDVKACFDQLKNKMMSEAPADVNNFLCSDEQKDRLDCVIKHFNDCPAFKTQSFIQELKHSSSGFNALDLFHVASADEFCKCAPTHMCMKKVETDKLYVHLDDGPWMKIANQEYICGHGRNHIDCVAKSLPTCDDYLQFKHNKNLNDTNKSHEVYKVNIANLEYASIYADKHCKNWPDEAISVNCSTKRAGWKSVKICYNQVDHLRKVEDKRCGMRSCIEKAMFTCPKGEMDYFIDAINIFSKVKVGTGDCPTSAATVVSAMLSAILIVSICLLL